jgi:mannosyltransferase
MSTDTFPAQAPPAPGEVFVPPSEARRRLTSEKLKNLSLTRWGAVAISALVVLVSVWLRTRGFQAYYWVDEGLSVGIASHPLTHIPSLLSQDGSPPLYYMLLHVWMSGFGRGEIATHLLSLVFAMLTIPVAYWAGASLFSRRAGVICAVLAAGAPYLNQYGQETRMYALLALLSLVTSAAFVHAFVQRRRGYLPVFSLGLTASLYTHNWALFFGLMVAVAFLVCVRSAPDEERRALWRDGLLGFGAVAVLYAPWVPTLVYQARHTGAPWDLGPVVWSITQGLYSLVAGRGPAVALLFGAGAGLLALRQLSSRKGMAAFWEPRDPQRLLLAATCLLILGLGTILIAWAYSKITPAWALRYLAVIVGPLLLVFGLGLARTGKLGVVALVLAVCFWVLTPVSSSLSSKSNAGRVLSALRSNLGVDPLVLSTQPEQVPTLAYYLPEVARFATPLGPVPDPRVVDWRNALDRLRRSSVRSALMPIVNSLRPGTRVLLVVPVGLADTPLWLKLINRDSIQLAATLRRDRLLKFVTSSAKGAPGSGTGVRVSLFVVR